MRRGPTGALVLTLAVPWAVMVLVPDALVRSIV
jgi:hypothetical protein